MLVNGKQQCLCWQLPNVMFLYIILHLAVKLSRRQCQCFAFSYREKYRIKVYPISLYVQGWQQRYGWYGHGHTIFCVFYWTSQSHFQGACNIHARSDLLELYAHLLVLESRATIVLLAFSLNDKGLIASENTGTQSLYVHTCVHS